jgi:hypothetical protein
MRYYYNLLFFSSIITITISCKKENKTDGCFPGATTTRQIVNKQAVIKLTATVNPVYIVEQSAIDTKLIPCNLPMEFFQDDLQVVISGEVKSTSQSGGVCCIENFVITKITR